jgi:hypothetical protein
MRSSMEVENNNKYSEGEWMQPRAEQSEGRSGVTTSRALLLRDHLLLEKVWILGPRLLLLNHLLLCCIVPEECINILATLCLHVVLQLPAHTSHASA